MTTTGVLWAEFSGRLRGFIAKRVRAEVDIEDILQEVFAKIHAGLGALKDDERLEAWLFQIARRAITDYYRDRSGPRRTQGLPPELPEEGTEEDIQVQVASWLRPMMELLSEEDREAIRLADLEALPQKDLAARLGLSLTGAKSRVQRARKRLKSVLLECCHIDMDRRGNAIGYGRKEGPCGPCNCS
jgi:RNA polymerase sigma-70 factor (ECF subfamily)